MGQKRCDSCNQSDGMRVRLGESKNRIHAIGSKNQMGDRMGESDGREQGFIAEKRQYVFVPAILTNFSF